MIKEKFGLMCINSLVEWFEGKTYDHQIQMPTLFNLNDDEDEDDDERAEF